MNRTRKTSTSPRTAADNMIVEMMEKGQNTLCRQYSVVPHLLLVVLSTREGIVGFLSLTSSVVVVPHSSSSSLASSLAVVVRLSENLAQSTFQD